MFLALWVNSDNVKKLKGWLGTTARNKAINKLRKVRTDLPLDDDITASGRDEIEDALIACSEQNAIKMAIESMDTPDREIFTRHYYGSQTVAAIAAETGMTEAAVKHRLTRGRKKLGAILDKQEVF